MDQAGLCFKQPKCQFQYQQAQKTPFYESPYKVGCLRITGDTVDYITQKKLSFDVVIRNSIAEVKLIQDFVNETNKTVNVEYLFAMTPNQAVTDFKATLINRVLVGQLQDKSEQQETIVKGVSGGHTIRMAQVSESTQDILVIKLGPLPPEKRAVITITYLEELEVCMNKFWRLKLANTSAPRYTPPELSDQPEDDASQNIVCMSQKPEPMEIKIKIESLDHVDFIRSPTHKIITSHKDDDTLIELDPAHQQFFENDFILLFADEGIHQPQIVLSEVKDDVIPYCAQVTFIPDFNQQSLDDAYTAYVEENEMKNDDFVIDEQDQKGEYIFLLDRSTSMQGSRINRACEALALFLKSLPNDCYFQIYSIGSSYEKLFEKSQKYSQEVVNQAINKIKTFSADMGQMELKQPLEDILLNGSYIGGYTRNIFLLTDGIVKNEKEVVELIELFSNPNCRVYTLGIGKGSSRYLIENAAMAGGGIHQYFIGNQSLNEKVMNLLQDSITPYINENFIEFTHPQILEMMIPHPSKLSGLRKNRSFTFYIFLNPEFDKFHEEAKIQISYNHKTKGLFSSSISLSNLKAQNHKFIHQMGIFQLVNQERKVVKTENQLYPVLVKDSHPISKQYFTEVSLKFNVLTKYTACVIKLDEYSEQFNQLINSNVFEPFIESIDYQNFQTPSYKKISQFTAPSPMDIQMDDDMMGMEDYPQFIEEEDHFANEIQGKDSNVPDIIKNPSGQSDEAEFIQKALSVPVKFMKKGGKKGITYYFQIILKQNVDGTFNQDILPLLGMSIDKAELTKPEGLNMQQWIVILVLQWFDMNWKAQKSEWRLAAKKSTNYLNINNLNVKHYMKIAFKVYNI